MSNSNLCLGHEVPLSPIHYNIYPFTLYSGIVIHYFPLFLFHRVSRLIYGLSFKESCLSSVGLVHLVCLFIPPPLHSPRKL